jgi:hypothetical protein
VTGYSCGAGALEEPAGKRGSFRVWACDHLHAVVVIAVGTVAHVSSVSTTPLRFRHHFTDLRDKVLEVGTPPAAKHAARWLKHRLREHLQRHGARAVVADS